MSLLVNNISLELPLAILLSSKESLPEMDVTEKKVDTKMEGIGPYDSAIPLLGIHTEETRI